MNNQTSIPKPTKAIARKIVELLSHGLTSGLGKQKPGKMCVEAAVCFAFGLPHSDNPPCVAPSVRAFKIALNDSDWSSNQARAKGLKRLAIAQLGSNEIDEAIFVKKLALATIRQVLPLGLRAAAALQTEPHKAALIKAAESCEAALNLDAESAASDAASAASDAASNAARYAESAASDAASAARYAASAAASAASDAASAASDAASNAASAAASAASAARYAARDKVLAIMAEAGVQALIKAKSPGCKWLEVAK